MKKKKVVHKGSLTGTKYDKNLKKSKGLGRHSSMPKAVRFADGELELIAKAVKIWEKNFPEEGHSMNSFIRMSSVGNAKRTIASATGKLKFRK